MKHSEKRKPSGNERQPQDYIIAGYFVLYLRVRRATGWVNSGIIEIYGESVDAVESLRRLLLS